MPDHRRGTAVPAYTDHELDLGTTVLRYHSVRGGSDLPAIVLLHPWFGSWQFWDATVDALPEYTCHVVDGYSLGTGDWTQYRGPEGYARAVLRLLDELGLEQCALAGNSMGGMTAQVLASTEPQRISELVLIGTGPHTLTVKPDYQARLIEWSNAPAGTEDDWRDTERIVDSILARRPESAQTWQTYVEAVVTADRAFTTDMLKQLWEIDMTPRLPAITARTLVVRGENDAARTMLDVGRLLDGIPDSRYCEIADAGHSPMVNSADAFIAVLRKFLLE
jgi:3-oxoadipate enol-lactonase